MGKWWLQRRRVIERALPANGGVARLLGHCIRCSRWSRIHHCCHDDSIHRLCRQGGRYRRLRKRRCHQDHGCGLLVRRRRGNGPELGPESQFHRHLFFRSLDQLHRGFNLYEANLLCAWRAERCRIRKRESPIFVFALLPVFLPQCNVRFT